MASAGSFRIDEQEVAGAALEMFVISFEKDKMTLRVPTAKASSVGMRKLSAADDRRAARSTRSRAAPASSAPCGRAAPRNTRRRSIPATSISIAEVVRDLYRSETSPSSPIPSASSTRRRSSGMAREIAAVEKLDEASAVAKIDDVLTKTARHNKMAAEAEARTRAA